MDHKDLTNQVQVFVGAAEDAALIKILLKKVGIEGIIMDENQSILHLSKSGGRNPRILKVLVPVQHTEEAMEIIHVFENIGHH